MVNLRYARPRREKIPATLIYMYHYRDNQLPRGFTLLEDSNQQVRGVQACRATRRMPSASLDISAIFY